MARAILGRRQSAPFLELIGQTARIYKCTSTGDLSGCQAGLLKEFHRLGNARLYEEFLWANAECFGGVG